MRKLEFNRHLASHAPFPLKSVEHFHEKGFMGFLEERYSMKQLNTALRGVSHRFGWEFWAQVTQQEKI